MRSSVTKINFISMCLILIGLNPMASLAATAQAENAMILFSGNVKGYLQPIRQ